MSEMFRGAKKFDKPLNKWNVGKVENMEKMFQGASSYNRDLCDWDESLTRETIVTDMFKDSGCDSTGDPIFGGFRTTPLCAKCVIDLR